MRLTCKVCKKTLFSKINSVLNFNRKGTLCSYDPVIEQVKEILGRYTKTDLTIELAKSFFDQWYSEAVRDYIATSQAGDYCPLRKVLEATLERTLLCFSEQVELTTQKVELRLIMTAFDKVELVSEWPEVLTLFQKEDAQWDVLILSNGNMEETKQLLQNKMILSNVNVNIICCDDLQLTKPHPKVYSELMKLAVHNTKRIEVHIITDREMQKYSYKSE